MNLSPTDRAAVLEMVAANISREIILGAGGTMTEMVLLPLGVASKMLSLDVRTIKTRLPWVEITPAKGLIKLSTVQAYIEARTRQPKERGLA